MVSTLTYKALEPTYTSYFGVTTNLQQRQDFQLNRLVLGWMIDQRFRYFLYAWTSNASQGQGAQVVWLAMSTRSTNTSQLARGSSHCLV